MADITLCKNKKCRKKENCERFKLKPDSVWDKYVQVADPNACEHYRPIDSRWDASKK